MKKEVIELVNGYNDAKNDLYVRLKNIFPYLSLEHIDQYSRLYSEIIESDFTMADIVMILDYYIFDVCKLFNLNKANINNVVYCDSEIVDDYLNLVLKFDTIVNKECISLEIEIQVSDKGTDNYNYSFIYFHNKSNDLKFTLSRHEAEEYRSQNYNIIDIINDKNLCKTFSDVMSYFNKADDFIRKNIKFDNIDVIVNDNNRSNITYSLSKVFEMSDSDCMSRIIEYSFNKLAFIDFSLRKKKAKCTNILFIKKESSNDGEYIRFMITFKIDSDLYDMITDCYYLYKDEFSSKLFKITKEDK